MKQHVKMFVISCVTVLCTFFSAKALDIGVVATVYATPTEPYVEIGLEAAAASLTYITSDSITYQAGLDVLILIKKGDVVVNYEKYRLNSPLVKTPQSLLDVRRLMVPNGNYTLTVECVDVNNPNNTGRHTALLEVAVGTELYLTDIQLLRDFRMEDEGSSPFLRNGYYMEPLPFNFYDRASLTLAFYAEIYHSNQSIQGNEYNLRFVLNQEQGNENARLMVTRNLRKRPGVFDYVLIPVDISDWPSGNYSLTLEVRSTTNELLTSRKVYFQRSNPFLQIKEAELTDDMLEKQFVQNLDETQLRYALRAISPLMRGEESEVLQNVLLPGSEIKSMRYFLFRHFIRQDPNNPETAYLRYIEVANAVDKQFTSGFRYGFETDRGRVFLRYGRPDDMIHVEDDPNAPPYEIWVYYNFPFTNQKNVKFLFYNPSLAGEDFITLHSTARGEINNPRWELTLYKGAAGNQTEGNYHDSTQMQSNSARNARAFFEDF